MTQNWVNLLIFARLIFIPFYEQKNKLNHTGFNIGLYGRVRVTELVEPVLVL